MEGFLCSCGLNFMCQIVEVAYFNLSASIAVWTLMILWFISFSDFNVDIDCQGCILCVYFQNASLNSIFIS